MESLSATCEAFTQENDDWQATCTIFALDQSCADTHVRLLAEDGEQGYEASISLELCQSSTTAFARKSGDEGNFRFFGLSESPLLRIHFHYPEISDPPQSLRIAWQRYPSDPELPDKEQLLDWLSEKCDARLQEQELSFSVCEFCVHEALPTYWELIHQLQEYRLILLPPKPDNLYHSNVGTSIHPLNLSQQGLLRKGANDNIPTPKDLEEYRRQALIASWDKLYSSECPICFDTFFYVEGKLLPTCHHFVCNDCLKMYLTMKTTELNEYRTNPFCCPYEKCRRELPLVGFVKKIIEPQHMDRIRTWYQNLKYPPCFSLDRCLSKKCKATGTMRHHPTIWKRKKTLQFVFCVECERYSCEDCLKPVTFDDWEHDCQDLSVIKLCRRYTVASDVQKLQCEERFPWIAQYAHSKFHDGEAKQWLRQNGQSCPNCATGVERTEGCFHMKCPNCGTEIFAPFYGTHHCWLEDGEGEES